MNEDQKVTYAVQFLNQPDGQPGAWLRVEQAVPTIEEAREVRSRIEENETWTSSLRIVKITEEVVVNDHS